MRYLRKNHMSKLKFENLIDSATGLPIEIDIGDRDPSEFEEFKYAGRTAALALKCMLQELEDKIRSKEEMIAVLDHLVLLTRALLRQVEDMSVIMKAQAQDAGYVVGATVRQYHNTDKYDDAVISRVHDNGALDVIREDGSVNWWSISTCKPINTQGLQP